MRPRLLDIFCGGGGGSMGYYRAGFDMVGVDIRPQPRYPFEFHQVDALAYVAEHGHEFCAIHASPPCQAYSSLRHLHKAKEYPDLIGPTRDALLATGKPYVIENVEGAPLLNPVCLCGTMFGLKIFRHRLFESSFFMLAPPHASHRHYGKAAPQGRRVTETNQFITVTGNFSDVAVGRAAMGIDWMNRAELTQAIPPAYTEWIGERLMEAINA